MNDGRSGWDGILQDGETILWQGQPVPGLILRDMISSTTLFGAIFTTFSTFWIGAAFTMTQATGAPGIFALFPLFGLPFLLVGLYMLGGHVVIDAMRRARTWYTLTNRTAFIATEFLGRKALESYPLDQMPFIRFVEGDPGTIEFAEAPPVHRRHYRTDRRIKTYGVTSIAPGFRRVADARDVYAKLRRARRDLSVDDLR